MGARMKGTPAGIVRHRHPGFGRRRHEGHARGDRALDEIDRARPLNLAERRMDDEEAVRGGTMRESRIVIAWLSLPPEELTATSAPRSIRSWHWAGTGMAHRRRSDRRRFMPRARHGR